MSGLKQHFGGNDLQLGRHTRLGPCRLSGRCRKSGIIALVAETIELFSRLNVYFSVECRWRAETTALQRNVAEHLAFRVGGLDHIETADSARIALVFGIRIVQNGNIQPSASIERAGISLFDAQLVFPKNFA